MGQAFQAKKMHIDLRKNGICEENYKHLLYLVTECTGESAVNEQEI